MSYEYKDEISDDIGPEPNSNYQKDSDRYYAKLKELDEVYAKAESYDELANIIKGYEGKHKHDTFDYKDSNTLLKIVQEYESEAD